MDCAAWTRVETTRVEGEVVRATVSVLSTAADTCTAHLEPDTTTERDRERLERNEGDGEQRHRVGHVVGAEFGFQSHACRYKGQRRLTSTMGHTHR